MADKYKDFCTTPQDPIAKPPADYSTGGGTFNGEPGYPKRNASPELPKEKIYDGAVKAGTPTDETRGTKA